MPTRFYSHLSAEERDALSLGLAHGHSLRTMASVLGRAPSTLSRELARNVTRGRPYWACAAHTLVTGRARKVCVDLGRGERIDEAKSPM